MKCELYWKLDLLECASHYKSFLLMKCVIEYHAQQVFLFPLWEKCGGSVSPSFAFLPCSPLLLMAV